MSQPSAGGGVLREWTTRSGHVISSHAGQLLISADTTTAAARSVTSGPGMPNLLGRFARSVRTAVAEQGWQSISVDNPARAFQLRAH